MQCNCRGGPDCCMRRGHPAPLPPDQIKPDVGICEGEGQSRAGQRRGAKCACGTYLDDAGRCVNADMGHRLVPPPPPSAPEGWALDEFGSPRPSARLPLEAPVGFSVPEAFSKDDPRWRPSAIRRFWWAIRPGGGTP